MVNWILAIYFSVICRTWTVISYGTKHHMVYWKSASASEDIFTSIFRVECRIRLAVRRGPGTTRCPLCRLIRLLSTGCSVRAFFSASGAALSQEVPTLKWMSSQPALWTPDTLRYIPGDRTMLWEFQTLRTRFEMDIATLTKCVSLWVSVRLPALNAIIWSFMNLNKYTL
jgi:hypothetical protein